MLNSNGRKERKLLEKITLFQAIMYGIGLILGAGIYVLIGDVAGIAGNVLWISFAVASVIAAFTGLSYAELSSMFPKNAAEYVFVRNAFNNNLIAFIAGWLITLVAIASAAAVAIGFAGYMTTFFPQLSPVVVALLLVAALSAVNVVGIRESIWMNTTFTIVELGGLAIVIFIALIFGSFDLDYYELPVSSSGSLSISIGAILAAAGLAFFAYFGFENLANIAEESKNPSRTIPRALIISIVATSGIYIIVALSAISLVGWEELSSSEAPLALATQKVFGNQGAIVLSIIALFATSNTVLMMLVAGSRIMYGLAAEGALPSFIGQVHARRKTPAVGVIVTMVLTMMLILVFAGNITAIANVAVYAIFIVYALVNLSLIWLRYRRPDINRPFRSPIKIGWFPVLAGLGFASSLAMLTQFDLITMEAGIAALMLGLLFYFALSVHKKSNSSF